MTMRYLSVCSGIEAATVAWHPLGWKPVAFSEIEKFPSAVLAHHYPSVPNLGDMTKFKDWPDVRPSLLVGGTPCQSFSVAGLRKGMADPRGNLALTYLAILDRYGPEWCAWENVPGVLSSSNGRDFGAFLGGLAELGYGFAYRVLDAQYVRVDGFGRAVPQRRRRVFVVGNLRDWRRAAAVLFERESLQGNTAPRRQAGERVAPTISARPSGGGGLGTDFDCDGGLIADPIARCVTAGFSQRLDWETENFVAHSLRAEGFDASEDGTGRQNIIPIDMRQASRGATMTNNRAEGSSGGAPGTGIGEPGDPSPTIANSHIPAVAFGIRSDASRDGEAKTPSADAEGRVRLRNPGLGIYSEVAPTVDAGAAHSVATSWAVRRLTPTECERLQGFPDEYTNIPWRGKDGAPDGPRYKALGNSMAVNVMRWIGRRIQTVSEMSKVEAA